MNLLQRESETIYAPITAPASAGVGVIRVSGELALKSVKTFCDFLPNQPESHRIYFGYIKDPVTKRTIDQVLVSYFARGRSFTGEETVELSCHGSPAILSQTMQLLSQQGCKAAERGEFTFRAFSNGKIDLIQAESILSLIHSHTEQASQMSIRQLQGELSKKIETIEDDLTWSLANIEAGIDFSTEDIDVLAYKELSTRVEKIVNTVESLVASYHQTRPVIEGLRFALLGRPNAGKSSLLNTLLNQERAIVTEIPGTTRDLVEGVLKLEGGLVTVVDTAGLRDTTERIEEIGIKASKEELLRADVVGYLFDLSEGLTEEDILNINTIDSKKLLLIGTKEDCIRAKEETAAIYTSAKMQSGIDTIKEVLNRRLKAAFVYDSAILIQKRHYELLSQTSEKAKEALKILHQNASLEFVALELQEALSHVYELLGKRYDDQVMNRVFKDFCIGK